MNPIILDVESIFRMQLFSHSPKAWQILQPMDMIVIDWK